ncbi:MAG: hypothetical protein LLG14_14205 [Nocardiaceae bacterium]|nr:hypothetical protein [Nocardiaceae bacterium]
MTGLSTWFMVGLMLDAWAHSNLKGLESFFTPWHAVFYSGFAAVSGWVSYSVFRNVRMGHGIVESIPLGYRGAAVAIPAFAVFGIGDMLWHIIFGVETTINILFSPTHLGLAASMLVIVTSPLRAAWSRSPERRQTMGQLWPALLSTGLAGALVFLFVAYGDAIGETPAQVVERMSTTENHLASTLAARILITTAVLILPLLLVIKRWQPPAGTALLCGLPMVAISGAQTAGRNPAILGAAVLALLGIDVLLHFWRPAPTRHLAFYGFAATAAGLFWILYLTAAMIEAGVPAIVELWTGTPFVASAIALLLAIVVLPRTTSSD